MLFVNLQTDSQLCTLVIDHDWVFNNGSQTTSDDARQHYKEFCSQDGGENGDGATGGAQSQGLRKPAICQVLI